MSNGVPYEVIQRVESAILDALDHERLWRATLPMGDLHDHVTHSSLADEVSELVDWVGKRNRTIELLDTLHNAVPGNVGLQNARDEYAAAEKRALENPPIAAFAGAEAAASRSEPPAAATKTKPAAPPWAWMALGALILVVVAVVLLGGEDTPAADEPTNFVEGNAALDGLYDDCEAGDNDACDLLFDATPAGSEYNIFGDTCGGRLPDGPVASCLIDLGP